MEEIINDKAEKLGIASKKTSFSSQPSIIDKAVEERQKLELALAKQEELLAKQEELLAKQALGGRSEANFQPKEKTKQEIIDEQINNAFQGTGFDPLKPFRIK